MGEMMKEEKPMLQNLNSSTPKSHKTHLLLPSPPLKSDAPSQQKSMRKTNVRVGDDQPQHELHKEEDEASGRERLKRHRVEVAGRVWIPDIWGQESFLQDWIDCSAFDAALGPKEIMSARASLVQEGRRAHSGRLSC